MIKTLRGDLSGSPRETVHLCDRPAPDTDGDGVEDQHDFAPANAAVVDHPTPSTPSSFEAPRLRGEIRAGGLVTAAPGTWDGSPHPAFFVERWEHCDADLANCETIVGETGWQIVPASSIAGRRLRAVVRATNANGTATAASAGEEVGIAPQPVSRPVVTGQPRVNYRLYTSTGQWSAFPAPGYTFQWFMCDSNGCSAIGGATGGSWQVTLNALGKWIYAAVTARNVWGQATQTSVAVGPVTL